MLACIEAGKPVLCEKPLATTAEACLHVIDAEVAGGRRLVSLGFMRRFDPGYGAIKEGLENGGVGRRARRPLRAPQRGRPGRSTRRRC